MRLRSALLATLVGVLTGCAAEPIAPPPIKANDMVFRLIEDPASPLPPDAAFRLPDVTVYANGRVVRRGNETTDLWPAPIEQRLTPTGLQRLLDGAQGAGLTEATDFGRAGVVDGPVTTVDVLGRRTSVVLVGPDGTASAARDRLRQFITQVKTLDNWMESDISPAEPYLYQGAVAFALEKDPATAGQTVQWPLGSLRTGQPFGGGRCVVLGTEDLAVVRRTADAVGAPTWSSDSSTFTVIVRPLLPDETDCISAYMAQ